MSPRLVLARIAVALTASLAVAGCSKTKASSKASSGSGSGSVAAPSGPADPRVQAIIDMSKQLRDRACACQDQACAKQVRADHEHWLHQQLDEYAKLGEPKSTKAQEDEAADYQHALFVCLDRMDPPRQAPVSGSGSGSAAPAAGSGSAAAPAAGSGSAAPRIPGSGSGSAAH
ncbi:MAG TPA: hypothetical protein VHE35_04605 [Kofleriaceae bacterium]|nr:hypothetical protein [Kofleriaceae bacterium]